MGTPAALVEQPLEFEPRDGLVYITDPETGCIRAMRRKTFFASFHNAAKCMQECHERTGAEVIAFPQKDVG